MPTHDVIDEPVSVALLYQTSQLEGHLKEALNELGASVVYEALTAEMDRDALEGSGAHVVIVNLDPEIEAHLDEVYDLLDDDRYNVVFNDAQVSSGLSGWEQARWSRHLAAKIMGRPEVADPPRPAGAEAPPSPAQKIAKNIPDAPAKAAPTNVFQTDVASLAMFPHDSAMQDALGALFGDQPAATPAKPAASHSTADALRDSTTAPASDFGFDLDSLLGDIPTSAVNSRTDTTASDASSMAFDIDFGDAVTPAETVPVSSMENLPPAEDFEFNLDTSSRGTGTAAPGLAFEENFDFDLGATPAEPARKPTAPAATPDFGLDTDFGTDAFGGLDVPAAPPARPAAAPPADEFNFAADLDALFGTPATPAPEPAKPAAQAATADLGDIDFDAMFGQTAAPSRASDEVAELSSGLPGSRDLPSSDDFPDFTGFGSDFPPVEEKPAAVAPQAPKPAESKPAESKAKPSMNWSLEPLAEVDETAAEAAPAPAAKTDEKFTVEKVSAEDFLAGGNWSLEELHEESDSPAAAPAPASKDFGIEKVAAEEYLAPEGGDESKFDFSSSLNLDLVPIEEAVAPQQREEAVAEHRLDAPATPLRPKGAGVKRVIVLGASIGGPEAVREYLSGFPARFPALFILAQHMGAEFLELMAAQLAKATPLTVRSPSHGERVGHGEVVVVPTTHRLLVDAEGVVQLAHLPEASPYSPSIDLVLRDVADRFGNAATAIVFSGMAHDAIDGSRYLASKGGKVWVQDPDTCVISSMVDGAKEAGVVSFVGAPAELTKQTIAEVSKA
ncbi:chemotaxis protein CheB [Tahibacter amnicola]|uniref:protein-glutamate methylesterase n=1 Tax=Tahibacter amnicola TaxID=2976241 RepID=A0ABY6BJV3_9GAMM|nr:chemotaxis protein CheB [Tahibacter amnicola]UXI69365.1 chemotaxis protein CheB [Tahibacter amnicola]